MPGTPAGEEFIAAVARAHGAETAEQLRCAMTHGEDLVHAGSVVDALAPELEQEFARLDTEEEC